MQFDVDRVLCEQPLASGAVLNAGGNACHG